MNFIEKRNIDYIKTLREKFILKLIDKKTFKSNLVGKMPVTNNYITHLTCSIEKDDIEAYDLCFDYLTSKNGLSHHHKILKSDFFTIQTLKDFNTDEIGFFVVTELNKIKRLMSRKIKQECVKITSIAFIKEFCNNNYGDEFLNDENEKESFKMNKDNDNKILELLVDKKLTLEYIKNNVQEVDDCFALYNVTAFDIAYFDVELFKDLFLKIRNNGHFDDRYYRILESVSYKESEVKREYYKKYIGDILYLTNHNPKISDERVQRLLNDELFTPFTLANCKEDFVKLYKLGFTSKNLIEDKNKFFEAIGFNTIHESSFFDKISETTIKCRELKLLNLIADNDFDFFKLMVSEPAGYGFLNNLKINSGRKTKKEYAKFVNNLSRCNFDIEMIVKLFTVYNIDIENIHNKNFNLDKYTTSEMLKSIDINSSSSVHIMYSLSLINCDSLKDNLKIHLSNLEKEEIVKFLNLDEKSTKTRKRI